GDRGAEVFYLEDRYRFYPYLMRYHDRKFLYRYDRTHKTHRRIAETGAFSASPVGSYVLYAPPWPERFAYRERMPDFYILDCGTGQRAGYAMPGGFDRGYLTYGIAWSEWHEDGTVEAIVHFRYCPGQRPSRWKRHRGTVPEWRLERWRVTINPGASGAKVIAGHCADADRPRISWNELRKKRAVAPDGSAELVYSKYLGHYHFNSSLALRDTRKGTMEHIVKDNTLIGLLHAGKYILCHIAAIPAFGFDALLAGAQRAGVATVTPAAKAP
ncbi:MAG: hypothetical protein NT045_00425, partial [Candidatus Aureabacteria bacterium]|nr:hypothetical protein [Candidatus Auribacterota bacterium]